MSSDQEDWVSAFFRTADQCNADLTAEWFAENIDMRFANHPPVSSRAEAREGLRQFMRTSPAWFTNVNRA